MPDTDRLINKDQGDSIISAIQGITARLQEMYTVDDAMSSSSENPVQNKVVKEALDGKVDVVSGKGLSTNDYTNDDKASVASSAEQLESTQTVSGNPITLTDCAPINAESLVVELEPKQDLHGYDYPWVGGAGNNILNVPQTSSTTLGNVTLSIDENGVCTLNGLCNQSNNFYIHVNNPFANGESYSFCLFSEGTFPSNSYAKAEIFDNTVSNGILVLYNDSDPNAIATKTIASDISSHSIVLRVRIDVGHNYQNCKLYPMLQKGIQTSMSWAPWKNICPITGYTQTSVEGTGENLFGGDAFADKIATDVTGAVKDTTNKTISYSASNISGVVLYDKFKPNTRYTLLTNQVSGVANLAFAYTDGTVTVIRDAHVSTSTGGKTVAKLFGYYSTGNTTLNYEQTGLFEGAVNESDFTPYQSTSATIQFGQTVYGAEVDFSGGTSDEWDIVTFTNEWSDEDITQDGGHRYRYTGTVNDLVPLSDIVCDCFKGVKKNATDIKMGEMSITGSAAYPFIRVVTNMDFNDFKAYIVGKQACFKIPTPSEISTPATPLKLLKGTNNLSADGVMQIGYQPDNVVGELKGEIEAITEMDYLRILDNNVDTPINNYRIYYHLISGAYTLVNMGEMLQHRFIFVEVIKNPSGGVNKKVLHSALIDPRTIDGFEYEMKASGNDIIWIESILDENKFSLSLRTTGGSYSDGDPTDYYVTIRMVD